MFQWLKPSFALPNARTILKQKLPKARGPALLAANKTTWPSRFSDRSRYYEVKPHERLKDGRYEALRKLGTGAFSYVWLAKDLHPSGEHRCVVTPVLGCDLAMACRSFVGRRISAKIAKEITRQLLMGLDFLHDKCGVIHTGRTAIEDRQKIIPDVKADLHTYNICFEISDEEKERQAVGDDSGSTEIPGTLRIIDFGIASNTTQRLTDNIQPEHLRAPEVILGAPWGPAVDIWSLGCLVIEMIKGQVAFKGQAHSEGKCTSMDDHLARHIEAIGPMPKALLDRASRTSEFFDAKGDLIRVPGVRHSTLARYIDAGDVSLSRLIDMDMKEVQVFVDVLQGALVLDPDHRKYAKELLQHEWLRKTKE